ncbi:hypothetical protein [Agrobacterium tumefaciens]|uniref:hypothetical protein n=1 Tax=Agrobacterium tumefaciens TaxID=358 RepID=UPI0015766888|nr:hypothetical protein [Agrobacterium tumefaciens]NTZ89189.1 hypothetical protein [Agrobacterium tumefaciens]
MRNPKVLLAFAVLLGVLPATLHSLSVSPSLFLGISFFALNIGLCLLAATTTRYRFWWLGYGVACVLAFVLSGTSSPLSLVAILFTTWKA